MNCNETYTWCPEDDEGVGSRALSRWLEETMGPEWRDWWMKGMEQARRWPILNLRTWLLRNICELDAAELAELLFPAMPDLFLRPTSQLVEGAELNAVAYCALLGSAACLETLLELGADPNGLDCPEGQNMVKFPGSLLTRACPVTPLDCARAAGQEECRCILGLYGGVTVGRLCGLPEEAVAWEER